MRRPAIALLVLAGCATTEQEKQAAPADVAVHRSPPLVSEPQKEDVSVGYFPLPPALAVDPTTIPVPPLELRVVKPERVRLANGLTVLLMEDPAVPLVEIRALVAAGDVDDPADKRGVATLTFELLASGGAGARSADALDDLLELHAADASGASFDEYSLLELSLRSKDLDKLFPVFADMLRRPRFQKDRFDTAVAQYLETIRRRPDNPSDLAGRAFRKALFGPDHPLGREATAASVKGISLADVRAFHRRAVSPKSTYLLVAGAFEKKALLDLVDRHFGDWRGPDRIRREIPRPAPLQRRVVWVPKETPQAMIRIGGWGFRRLDPIEHAMRVVAAVFGAPFVGRLFREVRDERGLAYSVHADVQPGPVEGLFYAAADTRPDAAGRSLEAMLEILRSADGAHPITPEEVRIAADTFLNTFAFRFDSPKKIVFEKAVYELFGYPDDFLERYRERISAVDAAAAREAVKRLVKEDQLQIVVVGPAEPLGDLSRFGPVQVIRDVDAWK